MGYPQAEERRIWEAYLGLNRRRRRAILMRARKRVAPELPSRDHEKALRRCIVELLREESGVAPDSASHLFEVLRRGE